MADIKIDAKGLRCPLPIVRIAKAAKSLTSGQTIEISADDGAFSCDIKAWCKLTGNKLEKLSDPENGIVIAIIKKK